MISFRRKAFVITYKIKRGEIEINNFPEINDYIHIQKVMQYFYALYIFRTDFASRIRCQNLGITSPFFPNFKPGQKQQKRCTFPNVLINKWTRCIRNQSELGQNSLFLQRNRLEIGIEQNYAKTTKKIFLRLLKFKSNLRNF